MANYQTTCSGFESFFAEQDTETDFLGLGSFDASTFSSTDFHAPTKPDHQDSVAQNATSVSRAPTFIIPDDLFEIFSSTMESPTESIETQDLNHMDFFETYQVNAPTPLRKTAILRTAASPVVAKSKPLPVRRESDRLCAKASRKNKKESQVAISSEIRKLRSENARLRAMVDFASIDDTERLILDYIAGRLLQSSGMVQKSS
eukprot:CAMPEP_0174905776 /NCGR_PEP_ID=MMETSP0167-20121228/54309_1 /TAXON_ID=38298 /ORGANISM="Rhodella maculata, Strain CCMP736" /LENGTH=202 /DNA_ID=CAMNT_0016148823 /DNA_START=169 /DNA_END=777 /DNA_ORIENTATION=-